MKKLKLFLTLLLCLGVVTGYVWAGDSHFDSVVATPSNGVPADSYGFQLQDSTGADLFFVDANGVMYSPFARYISFPLGSLTGVSSNLQTVYGSPLATATGWLLGAPPIGSYTSDLAVYWPTTTTTPVAVTFFVPSDYGCCGSFKLMMRQSVADSSIAFQVITNRAGNKYNSSPTTQTSAALSSAITTSPQVVTLTPATDFTGLRGGDEVTFMVWKNGGTGTTYLNAVGFYYTGSR